MSDELERIRTKPVTKHIEFLNADGSKTKCEKCSKSTLFDILALTSDGYLLYRCPNCGQEFAGDTSRLDGLLLNGKRLI